MILSIPKFHYMKKIFIYISLFLLTGTSYAQVDRSSMPEPGPAPEIQLGEPETFTLENGLKVFVIKNDKLPRVTYSLILDRDPIMENEKSGMLGFVGEMMTAGTTNRSKDEFNEEVDFLGARVTASATSITASMLSRNQEKVLDLMADVLYNPVFPQMELDRLKTQSKSGLAISKNDPSAISSRLASRLAYGDSHPYGESETEFTVDAVEVSDIKNYYNTYFRPNIAFLAIVGDIDMATAKSLVNKHFSKWEKGEVPSHTFEMPTSPSENTIALVDRSASQQSVIDVTYPIENHLDSDDYLASRIIGHVIGGSSGRLFMNLREDKGWTYGAYGNIGSDKLVSRFSAGSSVKGAVTDSAVNEIIYEIKNLREKGITEEELEAAKSNLSGSFGRSLESPATIANFAINIERYDLPKDYYATYLQRLNALTVEEVNTAAKEFLKPENMYITVVGNASEIEEGLTTLGEVKRYTNIGEPERQLTMDADMTADQVIENFIKAIGGKEKAKSIKTSKMESVAEIQGTKLEISYVYDEERQAFANKTKVMGNVMSNTVIRNGKGNLTAGGQTQELTDEQFEAAKMSMFIIPELHYESLAYELELDGVKDVEGEDAYKVKVSNPTGASQTHFYSVDSGLRIKTESPEAGEIFYSNYEEVEGILMPMQMTLKNPMIPMPLVTKVEKIELNVPVSEEDLK